MYTRTHNSQACGWGIIASFVDRGKVIGWRGWYGMNRTGRKTVPTVQRLFPIADEFPQQDSAVIRIHRELERVWFIAVFMHLFKDVTIGDHFSLGIDWEVAVSTISSFMERRVRDASSTVVNLGRRRAFY